MLLTLCFCLHITVILSSGVAAMSTATMGISVNPTNSPTLRASPVTSTVYTVLSASATLPLFLLLLSPRCQLPTLLPFALPLPESLL